MDEIAKIEDKIVAARVRLLKMVEGLDEAAREWQPGDDRWSVRLTLAHVGSAQWSHLEVAQRLVAGERLDLPGFELDAWNDAQVAKRADWPIERVLADLEAAQRATLAFLAGLSIEELDITGVHPALGEVSVRQVLRIVAVHDGIHRRDVLQLLHQMGKAAAPLRL
jgi:uncharacterized damage-inducible protein DinB